MIESMVASLAARLDALRESGGGTAEEWSQLGHIACWHAPTKRAAPTPKRSSARRTISTCCAITSPVGDADGKASPQYAAALQRLRERLPPGSAERLAIEERLKNL